ncbi:MAG: hypothetical protein ABSC08_07805 [Bryobacteraceae bacterium]
MRIASVLSLSAIILTRVAWSAEPPQGQLDGSRSLFAVLAAINAAGYDADLNSPSNDPFRLQLRQEVASRKLHSVRYLQEFFKAHRKLDWNDELSQYISFALSVDGPPDFKWRYSTERTPPAANALEDLAPLLKEFWTEANFEQAWQAAQPSYDRIIARYHEPVTNAILQANLYLKNPTSGVRGRRFQIYVDLLGAPNQVHTRGFADDYFVVITPSAQLRVADVRRAYLHYLIDPVAIRKTESIEKKKALCRLADGAGALSEIYKEDCVLLFGMSLVRAVESRIDHSPAAAEEAMREGYILTGYFSEALATYEKQEAALRLELGDLIENINVRKERARIAAVQFYAEPVERKVKVQAEAPVPVSPLVAQLDTADKLIRAHDFTGARGVCRQVLEQAAPQAVHARAYFDLAKIAALEKDPDLSKQLFEKTLSLQPEAFETAWSHVYLARLAMAAQEPDEAIRQYEAALAVAGGSEQARQAAQTEMDAAKSRKQQ